MEQTLLSLPRWAKSLIFVVADAVLIFLCLVLAYALRMGVFDPGVFIERSALLFPALPLIGIAVILRTGMHKIKLSAFEPQSIPRIAYVSVVLMLVAFTISYLAGLRTPRSVPVIFGLLFFVGAIGMRFAAIRMLEALRGRGSERERVLIYGAGVAGVQLLSALRRAHDMRPVGFVDDNKALHGLLVAGLTVHSSAKLADLVARKRVGRVLLAIPSLTRERQAELAQTLSKLPVEVQFLPSFAEMMASNSLMDSLRNFTPDDLLGRNAVDPNTPEVAYTYQDRTVMVTGAGGSIGSELCRQLVQCRPSRLVLYEMSEFALYAIERELREAGPEHGVEIVARLGSVCDRGRLDTLIAEFGVDVMVHAAAYKHVPMVEMNEVEGARNNVIGTLTAAAAARDGSVDRFILISTDKAVRPTSVMGATKRFAEIAVQDMQERTSRTKFSLVRFGNVLGSSGSVIPLFKDQIAAGGPVTVTDNRVTRFFMTISEAAGLVLLAGAYATGGDVFVLDMGRPVRIRDLAERMIGMSGKSVRDDANPSGDIEIREVGLRPGEKLYEELLIDSAMLSTPHDKILRAQEAFPSQIEVARALARLRAAIAAGDDTFVRDAIADVVGEFSGEARITGMVATPAE